MPVEIPAMPSPPPPPPGTKPEPSDSVMVLVHVPRLQVTLLSAEVHSLPLVQLNVGDELHPISLTVEKSGDASPTATEMVVRLSARWYNPPLFGWEPLLEPLEVGVATRTSGLTTVNVAVQTTVDINISDALLRAVQDNIGAAAAAIEEAAARWATVSAEEPVPAGSADAAAAQWGETWQPSWEDADVSDRASVSAASGSGSGSSGGSASPAEMPSAGSVPYWLTNDTGEVVRYWVAEEIEPPVPRREASSSFSTTTSSVTSGSGSGSISASASGDALASASFASSPSSTGGGGGGEGEPPPGALVLQPGASTLLRFWEGEAEEQRAQRDWQLDRQREIFVQMSSGWAPVAGVVVNTPGAAVHALARALPRDATQQQQPQLPGSSRDSGREPRCLVCEVSLHGSEAELTGTRLTLRSMLALVNHTQRTFAVDVEMEGEPLSHLGTLPPGGTLPVPEQRLAGGLRLVDCGVAPTRQAMDAALEAADVAEATGEARTVWLPRTMSTGERRGDEEEAQWRALFDPPDSEFLVGQYACSLAEGKASPHGGELYVGSHSLAFRASKGLMQGKDKEPRSFVVSYSAVTSIFKRSGKMASSKGFAIEVRGEGAAASDTSALQYSFVNFSWANEARHLIETLVARRSSRFARHKSEENEKLRAKFGLDEPLEVAPRAHAHAARRTHTCICCAPAVTRAVAPAAHAPLPSHPPLHLPLPLHPPRTRHCACACAAGRAARVRGGADAQGGQELGQAVRDAVQPVLLGLALRQGHARRLRDRRHREPRAERHADAQLDRRH